jgi:hypothetical protein
VSQGVPKDQRTRRRIAEFFRTLHLDSRGITVSGHHFNLFRTQTRETLESGRNTFSGNSGVGCEYIQR